MWCKYPYKRDSTSNALGLEPYPAKKPDAEHKECLTGGPRQVLLCRMCPRDEGWSAKREHNTKENKKRGKGKETLAAAEPTLRVSPRSNGTEEAATTTADPKFELRWLYKTRAFDTLYAKTKSSRLGSYCLFYMMTDAR